MRFNNYIIISLLSHALILSTLILIVPKVNTRTLTPVFDVDIVSAPEEKGTASESIKKPLLPPARNVIKSVPENILKEILPPFGAKTSPDIPSSPEGMDADYHAGNSSSDNLPTPLPLPERHSFLFDKETIEKYAKKDIERKEKGLTFEAPELKHRGYMSMLKERIENVWKYPEDAAIKGITGDLYIMFSILRDGRLGEVRLIRASGFRDLDDAALKAVRDAEPYWPLPDDWERDELPITGHFIYIIGGWYLL